MIMRRKISLAILFSALSVGIAGIAAMPRVASHAYARQPASQVIATHHFRLDAGQSKLITPASLRLAVKTDSMVETSDAFTEPQKQIINKELREIVLEPGKYPEIVFKSTEVTGKALGNGQYDLKIGG